MIILLKIAYFAIIIHRFCIKMEVFLMDAQRNTYVISSQPNLGAVLVTENVIAVIAAMSALEVKGVVAMAGNITAEIIAKMGMKKLSKGVSIDVDNEEIMVDLSLIIKMGENIIDVSKNVQEKVKATIENMTCMKVVNVNVNISNVETE